MSSGNASQQTPAFAQLLQQGKALSQRCLRWRQRVQALRERSFLSYFLFGVSLLSPFFVGASALGLTDMSAVIAALAASTGSLQGCGWRLQLSTAPHVSLLSLVKAQFSRLTQAGWQVAAFQSRRQATANTQIHDGCAFTTVLLPKRPGAAAEARRKPSRPHLPDSMNLAVAARGVRRPLSIIELTGPQFPGLAQG